MKSVVGRSLSAAVPGRYVFAVGDTMFSTGAWVSFQTG